MKDIIIPLLLLASPCQAQTADLVLRELQAQGIPHANIVLAQARLETGNFKSDRCRRDHNLFGMKRGRRYAKYHTWQASISDYKKRISARYKGGDYYQFLKRIGYSADKQYINKVRRIANGK